jgi:hypothetical protein
LSGGLGAAGFKGEMGKVRAARAKSAITEIDRRRWGAMAVLLLESILVWSILAPSRNSVGSVSISDLSTAVPQPTTEADFLSQPAELNNDGRVFYPYSVISGGAKNQAELRSAVLHDVIVAGHYADFDLEKTHIARLGVARAVFVSYRVGNRIFWTKNRMTLPAGETVLTDGAHMARTRCGNRLSEVPGEPVLKAEPSPDEMEVAAGAGPLAVPLAPAEIPLAPPPTTAIVVPETPSGSIFIPPIPPIFPLGGSPFPPGIPSSPTPPGTPTPPGAPTPPAGGPTPPGGPAPPVIPPSPPPPPVAAPEPSSVLMLTASLACIWLFRRKSRA